MNYGYNRIRAKTHRSVWKILIVCYVLTGFWIALEEMSLAPERAVTISFLTLSFTRTWHMFHLRDFGSSPFFNDVTRN